MTENIENKIAPLVLVVEDDREIANLIAINLKAKKYNVLVEYDGAAGVDRARSNYPDLILLDVYMPKKDGREVCKLLKSDKTTRYIPIIMMTARNELKEECCDAGADEFLNKPFDQVELFTRVKAMLRAKSLQDELLDINKQLSDKVREKTKALESLYIQTVKSLANAIEAKDHYTRCHSSRVSEYSLKIAKEMGLGESDVQAIKEAAELHDLGKIAVPDNVLKKNGRLDDVEWELIRKHTLVSADILGQLILLDGTLEAIKQHHERFDGRGYPFGKKGADISIGARIIAVADSYEAMTSDRPYRKALKKDEAVNELLVNKGKQFDPEIVNIFLKVLKKEK